jgi:hypothetical protein
MPEPGPVAEILQIDEAFVKETVLRHCMRKGICPGPLGIRYEHVRLWVDDEGCLKGLHALVLAILCGDIKWIHVQNAHQP